MKVGNVVLMVIASLLVTATVMPLVLVNVPAARNDKIGMALMGGMVIATFGVIWAIWSRFGGRK